MNFRLIWKISVSIFVLVLLSVLIIRSTRVVLTEDHGPTNYGGSGTAAFAELLRKQGYKVLIPGKDKIPNERAMIVTVEESGRQRFKSYLESLSKKDNLKMIALDFPDQKPEEKSVRAVSYVNQESLGEIFPYEFNTMEYVAGLFQKSQPYPIISTNGDTKSIVEISQQPHLSLIQVNNAYWVTNEHIDQVDNASIISGVVKAAIPKSMPIVFTSGFDEPEGVTEKMGPFFVGAFNQIKVLILVILISLSFRFGLAPESRAIQRGGKELVDALATLTSRKGQNQWALRAILDRVLNALEKRHRVNRTEIAKNPSKYLPADQSELIQKAKNALVEDVDDREALQLANELSRLV